MVVLEQEALGSLASLRPLMTYAASVVEVAESEMVSKAQTLLNPPLTIRGQEPAEGFVVVSGDWPWVLEERMAALVKDLEM